MKIYLAEWASSDYDEGSTVIGIFSTNENESAYYVNSVHRTENGADKAMQVLMDDDDVEEGSEEVYNPWHVWVEEKELE